MKNKLLVIGLSLFLVGCSNRINEKENNKTEIKISNKDKVTQESKNRSSIENSSEFEGSPLSKEDIYGKQFKGVTSAPDTEITFTFADTNFDFMDGDVLSYYRNITEPDYQNERTRNMQFENMTIDIDSDNYIVKSKSADTETVHSFKKIDDSTIAWISEGKEIILKTIDLPIKNEPSKEVTAENLMVDYPSWSIESGITVAAYNNERKAEANRRLVTNGLPEDDDFINRNPIVIDRETENKIHEMVGNLDYMPVEANKVINGVIVNE